MAVFRPLTPWVVQTLPQRVTLQGWTLRTWLYQDYLPPGDFRFPLEVHLGRCGESVEGQESQQGLGQADRSVRISFMAWGTEGKLSKMVRNIYSQSQNTEPRGGACF